MLNRIVNAILSDEFKEDKQVLYKTRALVILWMATTTVMWLYVYYTYNAFRGLDQTVVIGGLIATIIHTLSPIVFKITQSFTFTGLTISLSGLFFQTLFCLFSGGAYSPSTIWLSFHPVILGFFGSTPWIIFSVSLNTIIILGMTLLGFYGMLPPNILPQLFRDGMIVTSYVGLDILVALFTIVAIKINNDKNKQLAESRDLTENLVRILCHDIRNPLTTIKISSSLLTPENLHKNEKLLERLERATLDIQNIIESVNNWSIHKDGKAHIVLEEIFVHEIVEHLKHAFSEKLSQKNLSLTFHSTVSNQSFIGDKNAVFYQIFNNLLSNAIKFSYNDSTIDFKFYIKNQNIVFDILDNGVGIDPNLCEKVFSPYEQTTKEGTNKEKGTGFGLPIAATIIKNMKGEISIHNRRTLDENTSGTLVRVSLPLKS